jgi:hypothetical protein
MKKLYVCVSMAYAYWEGGGVYSANFPTIQDFTQELKSRIAQNEFIKAQNFNASTYTNS